VNFVSPSAMPHRMPTGWTLDSGDYAANLDAALELAGYRELRERQTTLRAEGRFFGIGVATFSESSGVGPSIGMESVGFRRAGYERARKVLVKARKIAAHKLQRRPEDLTFEDGVFRPSDGLGVIAAAAHAGKKVEDKVVHAVFRRRMGMDLPPSDREGGTVTF